MVKLMNEDCCNSWVTSDASEIKVPSNKINDNSKQKIIWVAKIEKVPDPQLVEYINTVNRSTKLDFINRLAFSTSHENAIETNEGEDWKHFDNTYYEFSKGEIVLSNVRLISEPKPDMTGSNPDFLYGSVDTRIKWEPVILEASYELNQKPTAVLNETISNSGILRLIWNKVEAKGYFTFNSSGEFDGFSSTNYALNFLAKDAQIVFVDRQQVPIDGRTLRAIGRQLGRQFQDNLFWKLQSKLRKKIDRFLVSESVDRFFNSKPELIVKYETFIDENQNFGNSIIDGILNTLKGFLKEAGMEEVPVPGIKREFTRNFGFINVWGFVEVDDGSIRDVGSLKRVNEFSMVVKDGVFHIVGVLEFSNLMANFPKYRVKIWNIAASGKILVKVRKNSLDVNLAIRPDISSPSGFKILDHKVKVNLENFKVTATGLSIALNWLINMLGTTAANNAAGQMSQMVEQQIQDFLNILS